MNSLHSNFRSFISSGTAATPRRRGGPSVRSRSAQPRVTGGKSTRANERLCTKLRWKYRSAFPLAETSELQQAELQQAGHQRAAVASKDMVPQLSLPESASPVMMGVDVALLSAAAQRYDLPDAQKRFIKSLLTQMRGNEVLLNEAMLKESMLNESIQMQLLESPCLDHKASIDQILALIPNLHIPSDETLEIPPSNSKHGSNSSSWPLVKIEQVFHICQSCMAV